MKYLTLILFFSIPILAWAQDDITYHRASNAAKNETKKTQNKNYLERISIGGTGGLQVSSFATFIEISPNAAYHFNDVVCVGLGVSYIFYRDGGSKYTDHVFGTTVFTEAHFLKFLGVHAAYQALNYKMEYPTISQSRAWSNNICLGGGYYQRAGNIALYLYVLYNFSDKKETIYSSPLLFKTGVSVFLR